MTAPNTGDPNTPQILKGSVRGPADEYGNSAIYTTENAHEMHNQFSDEHLQTLKDRGVISGNFEPKKADIEADATVRASNVKDERNRGKGPNEGKHFVAGEEHGGHNEGKTK